MFDKSARPMRPLYRHGGTALLFCLAGALALVLLFRPAPTWFHYLAAWLLSVNVVAFVYYGYDKSCARSAARVIDPVLGRQRLLDLDDVFPVVSEIVGVGELLEALSHDLAQLPFALVLAFHHPVRVRCAILLAADLEGMQMSAIPPHAGLDRLM